MKDGCNGGSGKWTNKNQFDLMQSFNVSGLLGLWHSFMLSE